MTGKDIEKLKANNKYSGIAFTSHLYPKYKKHSSSNQQVKAGTSYVSQTVGLSKHWCKKNTKKNKSSQKKQIIFCGEIKMLKIVGASKNGNLGLQAISDLHLPSILRYALQV